MIEMLAAREHAGRASSAQALLARRLNFDAGIFERPHDRFVLLNDDHPARTRDLDFEPPILFRLPRFGRENS